MKKPSTAASAAAQLLVRHAGREAANGDSIEFFSALPKCQPDPHVTGQTGRGPGRPAEGRSKVRRGSSGDGTDELLSSEIGKHDYDWLLTPPATPLWSQATRASDHQVSAAAVPSRLARARSTSHAKSNSRLGPTGRPNETSTLRLARSSSAMHSSINTPAIASSGHVSHVRTLSSVSASSINTAASNASVSSTALGSATTSPRTPGTARSAWATARPCRRDKEGKQATCSFAGQSRASSKSNPGPPAPTCSRAHATPSVSSPRSTTSTFRRPAQARRADVVVSRSRLASQSSGTGSTAQTASSSAPQPRDVHLTRGARALPSSSSNGIKTWPVSVAVKQNDMAAANATTQRWRQSLAPAIAAARNARREDSLDNGSRRNSARRKINTEKATPQRTAVAAVGNGLARTGSRKSANSNAERTVNENDDGRRQDVNHGGALAHRKQALQHRSSRSVASRSRLGLTVTASEASGSISKCRFTSENGHRVAACARIAGTDAFPSTRYDAMLLREDPKNLTWLRGCDDGDDGSGGGLDLVDGSLEPFDVATGLRGTAFWCASAKTLTSGTRVVEKDHVKMRGDVPHYARLARFGERHGTRWNMAVIDDSIGGFGHFEHSGSKRSMSYINRDMSRREDWVDKG
ncbi:uncharacterized protein LOC133928015 [Phragmites australis]|uniref:uncharacterized protein LOC133928015 n=1 Tax=Phragmites australis TaxID=29695 RepID=UPI002D777EF2|nr:uncharacterized protein LOC133928015 [Phragmites australis]